MNGIVCMFPLGAFFKRLFNNTFEETTYMYSFTSEMATYLSTLVIMFQTLVQNLKHLSSYIYHQYLNQQLIKSGQLHNITKRTKMKKYNHDFI